MFYKLIEKKRNEWLDSSACTVKELINYIITRGQMRDAQIEAIKTYLYLKLACDNAPLWKLFTNGTFCTIDLDSIPLSVTAREILNSDKAAAALLEYSRLTDRNGRQLAPEMERFIKEHPDKIDYQTAFRKIFYNIDYADYLFSLPMGAGKTYLMAAFIYLDLYFALNEPDNPRFAHNFMIFVPSGLKSSIIPSLKHIQEFDPTWIIPNPAADNLRKLIKFEILDEQKSARKSNLLKNPNAQKINNHQPLEDLIGLVAITNAEKVILDRAGEDIDDSVFSKEDLERIILANELRSIIGKIPNLAVYIDEVHHAADSEIKLRQVVTEWTKEHTFNGVLGFSGTPYLEKPENIRLAEQFTIRNTELSNIVYHYPLINAVGNFLKKPVVKYSDNDTEVIIHNGVNEFLEKYGNKIYPNGTKAKLAIYCGQIETLEEQILPQVSELVASYGLNPAETILKYHGGNKKYPKPEGSETEFLSLDTELSRTRIVLLVQIGKEGWDCKSLTGVILPHKGVCPTNMVLQTCCRCLRQVTRHEREDALIWLNKFNADILNRQLRQQQNISLQELNTSELNHGISIERFSRMDKLKVPPIDFYQLKVSYNTLIMDEHHDTAQCLRTEKILKKSEETLIHQQDFSGEETAVYFNENKDAERTDFNHWIWLIAKESFGTLSISGLKRFENELKAIFECITVRKDGGLFLNQQYDQDRIRSLIRCAFTPKRGFSIKEETIPCHAGLLQIEKLSSPIIANDDESLFYPPQNDVREIIELDEKPSAQALPPDVLAAIKTLASQGIEVPAVVTDRYPEREKTYHYLPYRFDSPLERMYFIQSLTLIKDKNLEIYFNGDDTLTEFKIDCYKRNGTSWAYIGKYTPDFLIMDRKDDGSINRIAIIETKGEVFAAKFADRRHFMETEFIKKNNEKFGYERFCFLYLEDTIGPEKFISLTLKTIQDFFNN